MLSSSGATFFIQSTWSVVVSNKWLLSCQDLKLPAAVVTYDVMQDADYVPRHQRHSAQLSVHSALQERSHLSDGGGREVDGR